MSGINGTGFRPQGLPEPIQPREDRPREQHAAPMGAVKTAPARRDRSQVDPQIREAAEGMEAMFINQMMSAMRKTVHKSEMSLESPATEIYQSMLDSEVAQKTARMNSVGLADQIIAYLESRSYNGKNGSSNEGKPAVSVHGGIDDAGE